MLRFKICFIDDHEKWYEYWKIKDYILDFDEYVQWLEEDWGGIPTKIKLMEIRFHKGAEWPYYEKEIIPNENKKTEENIQPTNGSDHLERHR